ncbi:MAG: dockerin type I repeat-containing protein [Ruminococcus sp.]|nr:dockerin type I repeat-containing protein [Ruminococcus sp.]
MKKILCITMVLVLFVLSSVSAVVVSADTEDSYTQPEAFLYGDVDLDEKVTIKDATLIQKFIAGLEKLSLLQKQAAKTNGGKLTVRNATEIQKYIAEINVENSKVGNSEVIIEPVKYKDAMIGATVTGDEIPFTQEEYRETDSRLESAQYFTSNSFYIFDKTHYMLNDLDDTKLDSRYTDEFFEKNALIVMSFGWDSSSYKYRVNEITKSDGTLCVSYTLLFPEGGAVNADVVNRRLYIEVGKDDIKDIADIVTYENVELY